MVIFSSISCKNCSNVWNRDVKGATNIYKISKNAINDIELPKYLCREKKDEEVKKTKNKVFQMKQIKKSVKVDVLTKS